MNESQSQRALYQTCIDVCIADRGMVTFSDADALAAKVGVEGAMRLIETYGGAALMEVFSRGYWRADH